MKTISCIAVDDEPLALELITDHISKISFLELKSAFTSPKKALEYLTLYPVNLIFIDIQMPGLTGLDFAKIIPDTTQIIFTTAFEQYAVESYNHKATDYLLKPIRFERLLKASEKALEQNLMKDAVNSVNYIFINSEHEKIKINLNDLLYIEGMKDYVKLFLSTQSKPILTRTNLKGIQELLPLSTFIRIHKSFIVNRNKIVKIKSKAVLINSQEIPLGDKYKDAVDLIL
jgi:two-component system LytT family response regulator